MLVSVLLPLAADAAIADADRCGAAIREIEAGASLPPGLLTAVAVGESGKYDPGRRGVAPWPWTVNNQGEGRYFATAAEAIAHVAALQRSGQRSIDVGCMQINLMHHPDAFASLEEAFDPGHNVGYGAEFLRQLQDETQSWTRAVERYHTADIERGRAYRLKVYERWQTARADAAPEVAQPANAMELAGLPGPAAAGAADAAAISGSAPADAAGQPRFPAPDGRAHPRLGAAAIAGEPVEADRPDATPCRRHPGPAAAAPARARVDGAMSPGGAGPPAHARPAAAYGL